MLGGVHHGSVVWDLAVWCALAIIGIADRASLGQACSVSLFHPAGGPVSIDVAEPDGRACVITLTGSAGSPGDAITSIDLIPGRHDLSGLLEGVSGAHRALFAQAYSDGRAVGPPLVIEPLRSPARFVDAWTARVLSAMNAGDAAAIDVLRRMPSRVRAELAEEPAAITDAGGEVCGWRTYEDRVIVLSTTAGPITIALRPDAAPRTAYHVRHLVEGGWFNSPRRLEVLAAEEDGKPFVSFVGEGAESGGAGCGWSIDFEPSPLAHRFGVVSMARRRDDPNSGSARFFICLESEACRRLDGRYAAFAEVVDGVDALRRLASSPSGSHSLIRADLSPAPPVGMGRRPISWPEARPDADGVVER